ncbi:hypothetical protein BDB00DRAFT_837997 [Zychaea mexicana]|uniref:uncharacterized protein n=1 Tax=Zychaea mexicana TaxID=64656 RepID=UPI0022FE2E04|nr:uncharacterized protein BDB00DRAFT_837997 [Zychaea mexicana]KAI9490319.1 hypothetical protein BDB00DRAFT_837997 [Zychaea mexicana]
MTDPTSANGDTNTTSSSTTHTPNDISTPAQTATAPMKEDPTPIKRKPGRPRKLKPLQVIPTVKRKVGRPRKIRTEEVIPTVKRKVGRPRKIRTEEETQPKEKRKPGRPRKVPNPTEPLKEKRRPGRPRKVRRLPGRPRIIRPEENQQQLNGDTINAAQQAVQSQTSLASTSSLPSLSKPTETIKRPRGRPPKIVKDAPKRKRGRPPKVQEATKLVASPKEKRGPGRPPKQKRGPGRPRKIRVEQDQQRVTSPKKIKIPRVIPAEADLRTTTTTARDDVKRGPGRPKKLPVVQDETRPTTSAATATTTTYRGSEEDDDNKLAQEEEDDTDIVGQKAMIADGNGNDGNKYPVAVFLDKLQVTDEEMDELNDDDDEHAEADATRIEQESLVEKDNESVACATTAAVATTATSKVAPPPEEDAIRSTPPQIIITNEDGSPRAYGKGKRSKTPSDHDIPATNRKRAKRTIAKYTK